MMRTGTLEVVMYLAAEEHPPIVPIWQELVVGGIAFALLVWVLLKFVFPRMEQMYQTRVEEIEGGLQRAAAVQAEANQLLEQYHAQLAEIRTEAAKIREDARADAVGIKEDVLTQAREESDRIIAAGRESLAAERERLLRELRTYAGTLSVELAGRIVGEALADEARRAGIVERFLTELEADGDAAAAGAVAR
jgi:F-type H+-transporting ATPase subunit b